MMMIDGNRSIGSCRPATHIAHPNYTSYMISDMMSDNSTMCYTSNSAMCRIYKVKFECLDLIYTYVYWSDWHCTGDIAAQRAFCAKLCA